MSADPLFLTFAVGALLAGGFVKGAMGVGLPLVAVPLLSIFLPVVDAIGLMTVPVLGSNLWQAIQGRLYGPVLRRFWPLLVVLVIATVASTDLLVSLDPAAAALVLGVIVVAFPVTQLLSRGLVVPVAAERPMNVLVGGVAGVLGGLSSLFGPPIATYLAALRLPRDSFVAACSVCFLTGSIPLYGLLVWHGATSGWELGASALASAPVLGGVALGQRVRRHMSDRVFYRMLMALLAIIGLALVRRGLGI